MIGLGRLATLTERVKVGTSILLLPLYPPALVAKQIADLDRATNGRVMLGVGIGGEYAQEFRAVQVPMEERGRRTNEMIPLLRRLWTAEEITPRRPLLPDGDVKIHPAGAAGGPPIIVAGRQGAGDAPRRDCSATAGSRTCTHRVRYADSAAIIRQQPTERAVPGRVPLVRVALPQRQPRRRHGARKRRARWAAPTTRTSSP